MDDSLESIMKENLENSLKAQESFYRYANKLYSQILTARTKLNKTKALIRYNFSNMFLFDVVQDLIKKLRIQEETFLLYCIKNFKPEWFSNTQKREYNVNNLRTALSDIHIHLVDFFVLHHNFFQSSLTSSPSNSFSFHTSHMFRDLDTKKNFQNKLKWLLWFSFKRFKPPLLTESPLLLVYAEGRRDIQKLMNTLFDKFISVKITEFLYLYPFNSISVI